jgi:SNF2-related domain
MTIAAPDHAGEAPFIPHPHQLAARDRILAAREAGRWGFLLGDRTGLGKTLAAWLAIAAMPEDDVLVICPRGAIPHWRRTIALSGCRKKTVTILNYERTKSLLAPAPAGSARSVRARNRHLARHGSVARAYKLVIFDEAHRLRNPYAQQTMACRSLAEAARFRLFLSATAGQTPHELGYLGPLLGEAAGVDTATLKGFRELMKHLGIGRAKGRWTNWQWEANERDRARMARLLYTGPKAIGMRRRPEDIAGWPEIQRVLAPTALGARERRLYEATWREFRRELGLAGGSVRRPTGWAADLRFRQKASLLRIGGTADLVEDLLGNGFQVAVSVAYLETAALLASALAARHWRVGAITGAMSNAENEASRLAFQTGRLDVVAFTATESISLHQGELPGGEKPRALVAHDLRYSAIQMAQIEGRCHRNGVAAAVWYAFAESTIEERIAATVIARMLAMDGMAGDDTALLAAIAEVIEAAAEERAA